MSFSQYARGAAELLGAQIRSARTAKGWTQQKLADLIHVSRPTLAQIEKGNPKVAAGNYFDAAFLTGVELFEARGLDGMQERVEESRLRARLMPKRAAEVNPSGEFDDLF